MNESTENTIQLLSIDAWREGYSWVWNQWFKRGRVPAALLDKPTRYILAFLREENYLSNESKGRVAIEDDGYNLVIVCRGTREPILAIEYGAVS